MGPCPDGPSPSNLSDVALSDDTTRPWSAVLLLVAASALAAGLGEFGVILAGRLVLGRYALLNPQGLWLTPLVNAVAFAIPIGLAAAIGARRRGFVGALRWGAFMAATLAVLAVLVVVKDRLHVAAFLALAGGVGARVAGFAAASPDRFLRVGRRVTAALATISVVGSVGFNATRAWRERGVSTDVRPPEGAPNVILLVLDTVRAMSLGAYGYGRPTSPFLDELASTGVLFERAMAPSPWTLPSHASMFTGRNPHELSSTWTVPLDDTHPTLAERMRAAGYLTAGFAANLHYCSYEFGVSRGFAYYRDYDVSWREGVRSAGLVREAVNTVARRGGWSPWLGRQTASRIFERFLGWHEDVADTGRPFFAFLNVYDAHAPYAPPAPWDTLFLGRPSRVREPEDELVPADALGDLLAAYDASIAWQDSQIRALFEELERRGALDNTLVIVTADHGEEFREHGFLNHGSSLYLPSVHVPLMMAFRGRISGGQRVPDIVSLRDIPATILEVAGLPKSLPGSTLLDGSGAPTKLHSPVVNELDFARNLPAHLPVTRGDMKAVFEGPLRYILNGDSSGELYDVIDDPAERRDLDREQGFSDARDTLRARALAIPGRPRQ